jgi:prevent-host-death family protein
MRSWQLQEARSRIADVLDAATAGEPQRITRRGKRAVVVVSEDEWNRLAGEKPDFGAFLMNCPITPADLPARRPARVLRSGLFDD